MDVPGHDDPAKYAKAFLLLAMPEAIYYGITVQPDNSIANATPTLAEDLSESLLTLRGRLLELFHQELFCFNAIIDSKPIEVNASWQISSIKGDRV